MGEHAERADLFEKYIENYDPVFQETARRIYASVTKAKADFDAAIKWQQFTFARDRDFHHWICAVKSTKKGVCLVFHYGGLLVDRSGMLIAGQSIFFRKLEFRSPDEVRDDVINDLVSQALGRWQYFKDNWRAINREQAVFQVASEIDDKRGGRG